MLKKIYSLLASILLLSACTADDMTQKENPADDSNVTVSFQVDVPSATVITKSAGLEETGVQNLQLITFDVNGIYLGTVAANYISGNSYSASISKETRRVQFISSYDGYASITTPTAAATAATGERVFFAEQTLAPGFTGLQDVELLRNWSKISLEDKSGKLSGVEFMVYNASTKATVAPGNNTINVPAGNTLSTEQSFVSLSESLYPFEQLTSGDTPAFVIVKAKFDNSRDYTYYKLDLAVTNPSTGVVTNYDIIRNNWYKITISEVQRKGVTWDEVIKSGKIADNNITASAILDKYPSISFGGETLEVGKTTFVFTKASGNELSLLATYKNTNAGKLTGYAGLSLVQDAGILSEVVDGNVSMKEENSTSGRITASINNPSGEEKVAYFYVKGGDLQRKITLILRSPYVFENVYFYRTSDVNASYTDGVTNKIVEGPDNSVWLGFTIPESVDASIFPLECKIKSTTLYSVTDGVRIETDPANDKVYYYIYTAKVAGRHSVQFKTNATTPGETTTLSAEYFADASAEYVTDAPRKITGALKFATNDAAGSYITSGSTVSYTIDGETKTFKVGSNGSYTLSVPNDMPDSKAISFSYTDSNNKTYKSDAGMTVGDLAGKTIVLRRYATLISGIASYYSEWYGENVLIQNATISYTINDGAKNEVTTNYYGNYSVELPNDASDNTVVKFSYSSYIGSYALETTVGELKSNPNIVLLRVYLGTMRYAEGQSGGSIVNGTVYWQSEDGTKSGSFEVTNGSYSTTLDNYDISDGVFFTYTSNGTNYFLYRTTAGDFTLTRTIGNGSANIKTNNNNLSNGANVDCYIFTTVATTNSGGQMTITKKNNKSSKYSLVINKDVTIDTKLYFKYGNRYTTTVTIGELLKELNTFPINIDINNKPTE